MHVCAQTRGHINTFALLSLTPFYGGIFLPPTCKINYVNMQENYVNMQENYVNMQVTNLLGESDFNMGKIACVSTYLT